MLHRLCGTGLVVWRFLEVELVDRLGGGAVWQTRERTRQHQVDEARVFAVTEAAPFGVFLRLEDLGQVARLDQFGPTVEAEHAGAGGRDERCERCGGNVGYQAQCLDIVRMLRPLIVADQRAIRFAARRAKFVLIDLLEQLALIEFNRALQIARQLALRQVEHTQLQARARLAVHHQIMQPAPGAFERGELRVMHDRVELVGQLAIDRGDGAVDGARQVLVERDGAGERLLDQVLHQVLRLVGCGLPGSGDDLIEDGNLGGFRRCLLRCGLGARHRSGLLLVQPQLAGQRLQFVLVLQHLLQQTFQLFRPVNLAHQVAQLGACLEQCT